MPPLSSPTVQVVNGVQPVRHENGLSTKGDTAHFGDIILTNHGNNTNGVRDKSENMATEPILTFESEDSFMKKAGPMKAQHVAGTVKDSKCKRKNELGVIMQISMRAEPVHRRCGQSL